MIRMALILASLFAVPQMAVAATLVPLSSNPGSQPAEKSVQQWLEWALSFDLVRDGGDPIFDDTGDFQTQSLNPKFTRRSSILRACGS
jgi:hypothetical protein